MSDKKKTSAFFLIDADEYKGFDELKRKNLELQKHISELMKYKTLHTSAENQHLKSKVSELEEKLKKSSSHSSVTTETLNTNDPNVSQVGGGDLGSSEQTNSRDKFYEAFQAFMQKHSSNQTGRGEDLTPQLPLPIPSSSGPSANLPETGDDLKPEQTSSTADDGGADGGDVVDDDHLANLVPTSQRKKALELLQHLKEHSSELSYDSNGLIKLNNTVLPDSNIVKIFPMLYKPTKNYESDHNFSQVVDEIASLGLGHLILRHYTVGITPKGKNFLKNRSEIRKSLHPTLPWYYMEHHE